MTFFTDRHWFSGLALSLVLLVGCAGGPEKPKPAELPSNPSLLGVKLAWSANIGAIDFSMQPKVADQVVTMADSQGSLVSIDAQSGKSLWRLNLGEALSAGVGGDGQSVAVVTQSSELVVVNAGQLIWRSRLGTQVYTPPLVAGQRVFVLGADRSVSAFDVKSGRKIWSIQRPGDALVLRQSGILMAVSNTLVVGLSGRLVGLNPLNGNVMWDIAVATPRGTNEIERLVDLVGGVYRHQSMVCLRAYQSNVACIDANRGALIWKKSSLGTVGLSGDGELVFGTSDDGSLQAWRQADGTVSWTMDALKYRELGAPFVLGRSVVVGDSLGNVHFFSRIDGSLLSRISTDGTPITGAPVVAGKTMVVVTRQGGIFGFQPE